VRIDRQNLVVMAVLALWAATSCADEAGPPALGALTEVAPPAGFPGDTLRATSPADNTLTEGRAALGRRLFFEPMLSRTATVSCASCHDPARAFSDPAPVSTGVEGRRGTRNAPALVNLAWGRSFFWDGRAATLEEQVGQPIENPLEMDLPLATAVERLRQDASYARAFAGAYDGPPSEATLRKALASFLRVLVSGASPYDRHLRGDDRAWSEAAGRGERLFFGEGAACFHCHVVGRLTNEGFFNNGSFVMGGDEGREALTGRMGDRGKFKVPALRNVAASAPYMHDGSLLTLEDVLAQYDAGGRGDASTDPQIRPLGLNADEKADLLAFLRALTDEDFLSDRRFRL